MSDAHGRDHVTHAELALDKDGKFLALKVSTLANLGAYLSTFAPAVPTYLYGTLLAGTYTTPAIYVEVKAVFTNTVPVDAYRGAGRPEATLSRSSASSITPPRAEASTRPSCAGAISSRRTPIPTRRRSRCTTTAATISRRSTWR